MIVNKTREERQLKGVSIWKDNAYNGILSYYPGVGKTYTTFLAIKEIETFNKSVYFILVPSEVLELQWRKKISNYFPKYVQERIIVMTPNKLLKDNVQYKIGTLIIDEIHEFHTTERQRIFTENLIQYERFLGLTGSEDDKNFWKIKKRFKVVDVINREEAIEKGFIADSIEYNLAIKLTDAEKVMYTRVSTIITEHLAIFKGDLNYANLVLRGGEYNGSIYYAGPSWAMGLAVSHGWKSTLDATIPENKVILDTYNPNKFVTYANTLLNNIRLRKDILYNADNKLTATLQLVERFNKVKTIIFSESTEFADKIGVLLNANNNPTVVYHSKLKTLQMASPKTGKLIKVGSTRLKKNALESISNGDARILSTTRSLDKGLDIPDLRMSITTSGSGTVTQYKQRSNRTTRKEEDSIHSDVPVLIINLYAKDTQDSKWVASRQYRATHKIIDISSIDEIMHTPASNPEFV